MLAFTSQVLPVGTMAAEVVVWLPELVAAMVGLDSGLHVVWPLPVCVLSPQGHWGVGRGGYLPLSSGWQSPYSLPGQVSWWWVRGCAWSQCREGEISPCTAENRGPRVTEVLVPYG